MEHQDAVFFRPNTAALSERRMTPDKNKGSLQHRGRTSIRAQVGLVAESGGGYRESVCDNDNGDNDGFQKVQRACSWSVARKVSPSQKTGHLDFSPH